MSHTHRLLGLGQRHLCGEGVSLFCLPLEKSQWVEAKYLRDSTQQFRSRRGHVDCGSGPGMGSAGWMWCTEIVDLILTLKVLDGAEGEDKRLGRS